MNIYTIVGLTIKKSLSECERAWSLDFNRGERARERNSNFLAQWNSSAAGRDIYSTRRAGEIDCVFLYSKSEDYKQQSLPFIFNGIKGGWALESLTPGTLEPFIKI
jgi:hypothetical protein